MGDFTRDFNAHFDFQRKSFDENRDTCYPMFYMDKRLNEKSGKLEDVEMVKIHAPGETLAVYGGKVRDVDRQRWPRHYEAFIKNDVQPIEGTPLAKWPDVANNLEFINMLKALGCQTVENLAQLTDMAVTKFHGGRTWRERARVYLVDQEKLKATLKGDPAKDELIAKQGEALVRLEKQLAELAAAQAQQLERKKPGRKPKAQAEHTAAA